MSVLLAADNISVSYGNAVAVEDAALELTAGRTTALVGPNGAGKTTLLGAIAGALHHRSGRVRLGGRDLTGLGANARARAGIVLVPQGRALFPTMSVRDNLRVTADALRLPAGNAESALDRFPILRERARLPAGVLSGGEQQMLALARAFMSEPSVLLLDEPGLGLAPSIIDQVMEAVRAIQAHGVTVLIAEPSFSYIRGHVDEGYVILRGRTVSHDRSAGELEASYRRHLGLHDDELATDGMLLPRAGRGSA